MGREHHANLSTLVGGLSMLVVGLTGGIGSGKTAVSDCFAALGVPVIDTDLIAREVVEPGQAALAEIVAEFGAQCVDDSGALQRAVLRKRIFNDAAARQRLEAILHPRIRNVVHERIAAQTAPYVLVVIPLLVESAMTDLVQRILVVDVVEEEQMRRVLLRDQIHSLQARQILNAQATRQQRLAVADEVLVNDGALTDVPAKVAALHQRYLQLALAA